MTRKKFNLLGKSLQRKPKEQTIFNTLWNAFYSIPYYTVQGFLYVFLSLGAKLIRRKSKPLLTKHWELVEVHFQTLKTTGHWTTALLEDEEDLYEFYSSYADMLEMAGYAELQRLELTRSQITRWPRLLQRLDTTHRTRYNRFLLDKSRDRIRVRCEMYKMPNGKIAQCLQGLPPTIELTFIRKKV